MKKKEEKNICNYSWTWFWLQMLTRRHYCLLFADSDTTLFASTIYSISISKWIVYFVRNSIVHISQVQHRIQFIFVIISLMLYASFFVCLFSLCFYFILLVSLFFHQHFQFKFDLYFFFGCFVIWKWSINDSRLHISMFP